jgi:hypothetical protein
MRQTKINTVSLLMISALLIGFLVRFLNLGAAQLSDAEASWALQAIEASTAGGIKSLVDIGPQPAYVFLTAWTFDLFGATNFTARFWPSLAGTLLVSFPFLLQRRIGRIAALIAAFGLAIDPGLATVSRQAGGPMIAASLMVLALVLWVDRRMILAGIAFGLALLSGPQLYTGMIAIGIALLVIRGWYHPASLPEISQENEMLDPAPRPSLAQPARFWSNPEQRLFLVAAGVAILILGTSYFRFPQGLAAWFESLAVYLQGWSSAGEVKPAEILFSLIVYQPFALLFGIAGFVRWLIKRNKLPEGVITTFLAALLGLLSALILIGVYPGRQVADLVWVLAPLWLLAGIELRGILPEETVNPVSFLHAGLILILAALFWVTLVSTGNLAPTESITPGTIRIALLVGIFALGSLTTILIALGWNYETSRLGTLWGLAAVAAVYSISAMWGASQLRPNQPVEFWAPSPGTGQLDLMARNLNDLSNWNTGMSWQIAIHSLVESPSLRWTLRSYPNTTYSISLPVGEMPPIILTRVEQDAPALSAAFRGQDFVWRSWPGWEGFFPLDFFAWLTFRDAPVSSEKIILWVRGDQLPGGSANELRAP